MDACSTINTDSSVEILPVSLGCPPECPGSTFVCECWQNNNLLVGGKWWLEVRRCTLGVLDLTLHLQLCSRQRCLPRTGNEMRIKYIERVGSTNEVGVMEI